MKLSVHLVTWNSSGYLPYLLESLRQQTIQDWELLVIDNNSEDSTLEILKKELNNFSVQWKIIENKENKGFAGAHNQAFKETAGEYAFLLNPDMVVAPDCFAKLVAFADAHPEAAVVAPRLMRWNFFKAPSDVAYTNVVDSLGLKISRNRRVVDIKSGEEWNGSQESNEVFGVSGTMPFFRRSVLQTVQFSDGSIFDETYHSYKEDVDLAFRLRSAGYKAYVVPSAVAYHSRSAKGPSSTGDIAATKNKAKQSNFIKYHSYKNHLATLYKNEYWQNLALDFPWVLWYETKKLLYFLLFDPPVLAGLRAIWQEKDDLKAKRLKIKELRKISWRELRKWWVK